jgi:hypothetical protein
LEAVLSSTTANAKLTLRARTQGLALGSYDATVTVSTNLPGITARVINVRLTVNPGPAISLSRTVVPFAAAFQGANPAPQQVTVTNSGGGGANGLTGLTFGTITYQGGSPGWLTPQISSATSPATITLNVVSNTLLTGNYTATLPVISNVASNSPVNILVQLNVGPPPNMAVQPGSLVFAGFARGSAPTVQGVSITNTGGGEIVGLSTNITYGAGASGWLSASFQGGKTTTSTTLLVQPTNTNLNRGTYTANIEIRSTTAGVASRNVSVTYVVSSFNIDVRPIFSTSYAGFSGTPCTSCHGAQAPTLSGDSTAVWNNLVAAGRVVPNFPNSGVLICKITGVGACVTATNMRLPNPQIGIIQTWISRGAPR